MLEDEFHFVMYCDRLKKVRTNMYLELNDKCDIDLYGDPVEVLQGMTAKENIKIFARHLERMWAERRGVMYSTE